ncbi:MAG: hypothetical protein LBV41_06070 [Cytophagaceae bacterium]|jgi:hypothetical protein|nr:hypothetical protein [Cytophagaceae bacterium]
MNLHIEKVERNFSYKLLLLADETVELVNRYLFDCMFIWRKWWKRKWACFV